MIVKMKVGATQQEQDHVIEMLEAKGLKIKDASSARVGIFGIIGDTTIIEPNDLMAIDGVDTVTRVQAPYKQVNRVMHEGDTTVDVAGVKIGEGNFVIMAGPCSVESEEQMKEVAAAVSASGAQILRGGAFKPRTSPYAFQGMKEKGLELLDKARKATGMPIVTELMSIEYIDLFEKEVDMIQIGARNMQNFDLLKAVGARTTKPVLLKRGMSATIEEWLMSAEYIVASGNPNVVLCERGIRTYEKYTRNTLDLSAVLAVKKLSHLPVIVDPSHATGKREMVKDLALAAAAVGADGLMIEVHNDPENALCDGAQSLTPEQFDETIVALKRVLVAVDKKLS